MNHLPDGSEMSRQLLGGLVMVDLKIAAGRRERMDSEWEWKWCREEVVSVGIEMCSR